jgi:formylmethanofuran dehydrogenase subunit E
MSYPKFFDTIKPIKLQDPIANILGVFSKGEYEISYLDVVKSAGHSCPTVAGAYIMTQAALEALYAEERSVRGNLKVEFAEDIEEGVAGVIGNVVSHITGATDKSGFKGLQGKFARHSLMFYNADINASARFTRIDTGKSVDVFYSHNAIPADPNMMPLMQKIMQGLAQPQELERFGALWQKRVEDIFNNLDAVVSIKIL